MITKRWLGVGMAVAGLLMVAGLLAIDWLGAGDYEGIGPVQRLAMIGGGLVFLVGLTLIPLGDRPA